MAAFRFITRKLLEKPIFFNQKLKNEQLRLCVRLLNYTPHEYDEANNPGPIFIQKEVQNLLKKLTRVDTEKVFRKRKLGQRLEDPVYEFMTDDQLKEARLKAQQKMNEQLQMPPVVPVRKPLTKVLAQDPALQGLDSARFVFTDITFGVKDKDRLIVVREPNGDLKEAEWPLRDRINQLYFPKPVRALEVPQMFEDRFFESLLQRQEYEFVLDCACVQFEPDDEQYQRVTSITYQHLNENNAFDLLRSTRHFGPLTFFLVWTKNIDNLILELIETEQAEEVGLLLNLFGRVNQVNWSEFDEKLGPVQDYIKKYSNKKGALELAVQSYREVSKRRQELEEGIQRAHGLR